MQRNGRQLPDRQPLMEQLEARALPGVMGIETLVSPDVVHPGDTVVVEVRADSTDISDKYITSSEWDITVPSALKDYIIHTSSSLPDTNTPSQNSDDFFYRFSMFAGYNRIDSSMVSGELDDNVRIVSTNTGPFNREGILGTYTFKLSEDIPQELLNQNYSFGLHSVYFYDTNGVPYGTVNGNNTPSCIVTNDSFKVVPEPSTMALLAVGGALGLAGAAGRRRARRNDEGPHVRIV